VQLLLKCNSLFHITALVTAAMTSNFRASGLPSSEFAVPLSLTLRTQNAMSCPSDTDAT